MESDLRANIVTLTEAYVAATGLATSTVLSRAAKDARFLERTSKGQSFTIRVYDNAIRWFAANWPEGAVWPAGVARPDPAALPAAAEPAA